jgi:truncated hemoglobin YjbI
MSFLDEIGGRPTLDKVHKLFYDKVYAHPWIGLYFKDIDQKVIESQQSDFMAQNFGGPAAYLGKLPGPAHKHMFINEELFKLRSGLLEDSLKEAGLSEEQIKKWMKVDNAFKGQILKKSIEDCKKRFATDDLVHFKKPA